MLWSTDADVLQPAMLLRVVLTCFAGALLGIERERHGRAAGLRTTLIVSLAACLAMMMSDTFYRSSFTNPETSWHPDPARLAAGILSGMGFLGAGVIIHQHSHITRGVTTAATLWFSSVIGLCFGAGALGIGLLGTGLAALILFVLPRFEHHIENDWYSDLGVKLSAGTAVDGLMREIESLGVKIKSLDWREQIGAGERELLFHLKYKKGRLKSLPQEIVERLSAVPGVRSVHWHD